ncbi:MAG: type II toxin-antitoxin system VapC family toxin, partial [Nostoc sp.]|uniref:type II toxin-antitoxin system VapC family toxin n=1 Tax=Nostoc sp. TaxID=1180 RepID=UPI002FEF8DDF
LRYVLACLIFMPPYKKYLPLFPTLFCGDVYLDSYISSRMTVLAMRSLEITASHALQAAALPLHHRDPFDRMLIAQAQIEEMTLVSADSMFNKYDISILWAAKS